MSNATWSKTCHCGTTIARFPGQSTVTCPGCHQPYNASGQRLRRDWEANSSAHDENLSDLEGAELAALRRES